MPGVVFEIGLGLGRTFNHMRHHMPERDMFAFDRAMNAYPDCTPQAHELVIGEMAQTLPEMAAKFPGQVVLAHSDVGSFDREGNKVMAALVSANLPACLAPGAIVMSDLPLDIAGTQSVALPGGAREGRYYLYRRD